MSQVLSDSNFFTLCGCCGVRIEYFARQIRNLDFDPIRIAVFAEPPDRFNGSLRGGDKISIFDIGVERHAENPFVRTALQGDERGYGDLPESTVDAFAEQRFMWPCTAELIANVPDK